MRVGCLGLKRLRTPAAPWLDGRGQTGPNGTALLPSHPPIPNSKAGLSTGSDCQMGRFPSLLSALGAPLWRREGRRDLVASSSLLEASLSRFPAGIAFVGGAAVTRAAATVVKPVSGNCIAGKNILGLQSNRLPEEEQLNFGSPWQHLQKRYRSHINSETTLQQHYNRLPIRKKFLRAIKRGTLVWDKGQVKLPPVAIEGYDPPKKTLTGFQKHMRNQYKGKFRNLRARRVWFHD